MLQQDVGEFVAGGLVGDVLDRVADDGKRYMLFGPRSKSLVSETFCETFQRDFDETLCETCGGPCTSLGSNECARKESLI